jgi:hypothetical protein
MKRIAFASVLVLFLILSARTSVDAQSGTPPATPPVTAAVTAATTPNAANSVRNTRYCEVLPVVLNKDGKLVASVYNTLGLNACPEEVWETLDTAAIKKQFNAFAVIMNGPRYWVMDQIIAKGATRAGETVMIGGLGFTKRAEVVMSMAELSTNKAALYQMRNIQRETTYVFKAGKPVYELVSDDGYTFIMQTYSRQVDPALTLESLDTLAARLKLPKGWKYQVVTLDKDLILSANGVAHLIQDDFYNSYQRLEPTDLGTPAATQDALPATPAR